MPPGVNCYTLVPHPASSPPAIGVSVELSLVGERRLRPWFVLNGELDEIQLPEPAPSRRVDDLWRHTCFELFVRVDHQSDYAEFNFAPSGEWAAYGFEAYRAGMRRLATAAPVVTMTEIGGLWALGADLDLPSLGVGQVWRLNLTAVIEEKSGGKSYWALAHPREGPPDFHHPDCFVLELPPPG